MQRDFRAEIAKLKSVSPPPDILFLNGYGPAYIAIAKQLRELNAPGQLTADMTFGLPDTLTQLGNAAEGVIYVDGQMTSSFVENFKHAFHRSPSSYAGYAYDALSMIGIAADTIDGPITPASLARPLRGISGYHGAMGSVSFDGQGQANLSFVVRRVHNGVSELVAK